MVKNFFWKPVRILVDGRLVRICENHASVLRRASHFRMLSPEETDFLSSCEFYQEGLLGINQLRFAAEKYFNFD